MTAVNHHFVERLPKKKKKNFRIVDVVSGAPFRQESTCFFYKMVGSNVANHHFVERLPPKKEQDCGRCE